MSIQSMKETRRKGESKRLDTIMALVVEAGDGDRLTIGRHTQLVDKAVNSATGLSKKSSRATFRSECELILDYNVLTNFSSVLRLSERMWNERKTDDHSRYHIVMKICKKLKGSRSAPSLSFASIEDHYNTYGTLPP